MELFLNLLWLLLAVPAVWVWRRGTLSSSRSARLSSLRCLLVLSCALMLLFPVVSATDDLHSMRPEIEESASSKRVVRSIAGKSPVRLSGGGPALAQLAHPAVLCFNDQDRGKVITQSVVLPAAEQPAESTGRAPPVSRLG